ncbi:MAG: UDP-N-acetylmuramoyl-L-alanine--D-glutamate ligase [Clostridia bacterium]|nr:UDP-N-acetylmuramoyl-L-alanine--D-glutamate ligase [Clostridia bacterium]
MSRLSEYLQNKKILILGMGREGRSSLAYIRSHIPSAQIAIADRADPHIDGVPGFFGADYLSHMAQFDVVLKSPGIPFVGVPIPEGTEVTCQTDLFLRFSGCTCVGVTGTKGKTTTSTLIHEILQAAELPHVLAGNIGVPVLDVIDEYAGGIAVLELSCHQLEFMRTSPHIAVFTNLYAEHLDHYDGFAGYAAAKLHIAQYQTPQDVLIWGDVPGLREYLADKPLRGRQIPVGYDTDDAFLRRIASCNARLPGKHNAQNTFFAAAAAECLGVGRDAIERGIRNFGGIEHRMEPVGVFRGVSFVNDSIATAPEVVLLELEALQNVDTLVFGGLDRGLDYTAFIRALADSGVRNLIGLPQTGHAICDDPMLHAAGKTTVKAADMDEAVRAAYRLTEPGKACLFSPAAASYNVYKSFEEKGRHFKQLVREYGNRE